MFAKMFRHFLGCALVGVSLTHSAAAAIFWFGGEDTSVTGYVQVTGNCGNGICDSNFARGALSVQNGTSTADPPANRLIPINPTFAATSDLWIHGQFWSGNITTTTNNEQTIIVRSPDGVGRIYLRQSGSSGTLKLSTADAARSFTDPSGGTATGAFSANTLTQFDLHINYSCSGAGGAQLYLATVKVIDFTGNLCTDAATQLNQVEWAAVNNGAQVNVCTTNISSTCWSELILANEDTRSMRLATCALQAAGNTQQFTPNTLGNVNKATISDTTFVSTTTNNQLSQWTCPTAAPTGSWGVKSQAIEARALASVTGPQNLDFSRRVSNANYLAGTTTALTNAFLNYRNQADVSPATSTTWGLTEIYNTSTNQLNIGIKSLP
jgi:hypothetical protein